MEEMNLLVNHVQECTQFTIDTESEKSNGQLALIQIQTIPPRLPLLVILIELAYLPSNDSFMYWDDMKKELDPAKDYYLFNWPILALMINIQLYFPSWYEWALTHCELCYPEHHPGGVNDINLTTQNYSSSICVCHKQSPYRPHEKWSLQKALIYAAHMFIDKSTTVNNWAGGLTSNNSILSTARREKMINYVIYDVFSTTYFIRPVLENWTFKSSPPPPLPANNSSNKKIKKKNINPQKLFNIIDDNDLEPISDDDEIYLSQLIGPVTNKQPDYEEISMDEHELNDKLLVNNIELIMRVRLTVEKNSMTEFRDLGRNGTAWNSQELYRSQIISAC